MPEAKDELTVTTINIETGQVTQAPLSDAEIAERENNLKEITQSEIAAAKQEKARLSAIAKLAELGLTAEEISAL